MTLREALSPNGETVMYQGNPVHVSGWAKRFLFAPDQLNRPLSRFSGGEQARVLIASLMLQPADLLILDEPTNDLDIPTLEVLEDSLTEFPGALVLVTHDRYMLDAVSTEVLALDGRRRRGVLRRLRPVGAAPKASGAAGTGQSQGRLDCHQAPHTNGQPPDHRRAARVEGD